MNNHNLADVFQHSLRVAIGATTVLVETLQDPQKRGESFEDLQTQFKQKTQEWSEKGEVTEQEALRKLEEWLNGFQQAQGSSSSYSQSPSAPTTKSSSNRSVQDLTEQIVALRAELESLRQSN